MRNHLADAVDEVIGAGRLEGAQSTIRGDREVPQVLRKTFCLRFKIRHNEVFEKALGYVRESN